MITTTFSPAKTRSRQRSTVQLANVAWAVAYSALWNASEFSTYEKMQAIAAIRNFIQQHPDKQEAYSEFVQRILLARRYMGKRQRKTVLPDNWLRPDNKLGFAATASWYERTAAMRHSLPSHCSELEKFALAMIESSENAAAQVFHRWRNYFIEQDQQQLLNLFLCSLTNFSYGI
jgi:hypothetical protein